MGIENGFPDPNSLLKKGPDKLDDFSKQDRLQKLTEEITKIKQSEKNDGYLSDGEKQILENLEKEKELIDKGAIEDSKADSSLGEVIHFSKDAAGSNLGDVIPNTSADALKIYDFEGAAMNKKIPVIEEKTEHETGNDLMQYGYRVADELTQLWKKLSEDERKKPDFFRLADCGGDGRKLFNDLIENLDDRVKAEKLSDQQKEEILRGEIDIIAVYRDKAALTQENFGSEGENIANLENGIKREAASKKEQEFGSEGEDITHMMEGRGREYRIAKLREEIELERKEYLEFDYQKNTAFTRVRKFFGRVGSFVEDNKEQDPELAERRAYYDNKLLELQKLLIDEARERGASDKELADLYIEFRTEQKITLAAEHDQVKIEQQEGSLKGYMGEKMVGFSKWYQKLPTSTKVGIGVSFMAGGLAVGSAGAVLGGVFAGLATARKVIMGMSTGVGASLRMEAKGQEKDQAMVEQDKLDFLENVKNMNEQQKFDYLSGRIKDVAIKDEEYTINKVKNQDLRQLAAGAAIGGFFASGAAGYFAGKFLHWGADYLGIGHHAVVAGVGHHDTPQQAVHEKMPTSTPEQPHQAHNGVHHSHRAGINNHNGGTHSRESAPIPPAVAISEPTPPPHEILSPDNHPGTPEQWNHDIIDADKAELAAQNEKYEIAASISNFEEPVLDIHSPNYEENLKYAKMLLEAAKDPHYSFAPANYEVGRLGEIVKNAHEHMSTLLNMGDHGAFHSIRQTFFDSNIDNLNKFEKVNVIDALKDPSKLKGLSDKAFESIVGYANTELTEPKVGEDFKHWTYRIMTLTRK